MRGLSARSSERVASHNGQLRQLHGYVRVVTRSGDHRCTRERCDSQHKSSGTHLFATYISRGRTLPVRANLVYKRGHIAQFYAQHATTSVCATSEYERVRESTRQYECTSVRVCTSVCTTSVCVVTNLTQYPAAVRADCVWRAHAVVHIISTRVS